MSAIEKWQGTGAPVPVIPRQRLSRQLPRTQRQPTPLLGHQRPFGGTRREPGQGLGEALDIGQVAKLLGCSPWTVRQKLIPQGLPHLRFTASGQLHFYTEQVIRWIEDQQQGGT